MNASGLEVSSMEVSSMEVSVMEVSVMEVLSENSLPWSLWHGSLCLRKSLVYSRSPWHGNTLTCKVSVREFSVMKSLTMDDFDLRSLWHWNSLSRSLWLGKSLVWKVSGWKASDIRILCHQVSVSEFSIIKAFGIWSLWHESLLHASRWHQSLCLEVSVTKFLALEVSGIVNSDIGRICQSILRISKSLAWKSLQVFCLEFFGMGRLCYTLVNPLVRYFQE